MNKQQRIVFLCDNVHGRGNYAVCKSLGEGLVRIGWQATIVALGRKNLFLPGKAVENGVRVVTTPFLLRRILRFMVFPRLFLKGTGNAGFDLMDVLWRIYFCLTWQYDVLYVCEYFPNTYVPALIARKRRKMLVVAERLDQYVDGGLFDLFKIPWLKYKWLRRAELNQLNTIDGLVTISTSLAERARSQGFDSRRICVIHGTAPIETLSPIEKQKSRERLGLFPDRMVLLFLGAGHTDLELLASIIKKIDGNMLPQLTLMLVGETTRRSRLLKWNLRGVDVQLRGRVDESDLPYYLSAGDVALLPLTDNVFNRSRWPHKIGEYLAAGLPTIVSKVGDVADFVVRHKAGMAVNTPEEFSKAIEFLLMNPNERDQMGSNARIAAGYLAPARQTEKLVSFLDRLMTLRDDMGSKELQHVS